MMFERRHLPLAPPRVFRRRLITTGGVGKIFAGIYAIYCGFAVLGIAAIMFAPIVHRLFHRFHIAEAERAAKED